MNRFLPALLLSLLLGKLFSQSLNFPLDRDLFLPYEVYLDDKASNVHTCIKPFFFSELSSSADSVKKNSLKKKGVFSETKFFPQKDSMKNKAEISLSPIMLVNESINLDSSEFLPEYAIGATLRAHFKEKFSLNADFLSGYSSFVPHVDSMVKRTPVVPGIGRAYYKENGIYSWQYYAGYLSYSPNKIFNFQGGIDKQFWGDGYRSLFLSDNAAPFPFLKITSNIWKIKYVSTYAMLTDATHPSNAKKYFSNKYGTFHMLSWNVSRRVNINFFESIIWQGTDSNRTRTFDVNYLNPVIFFRPIEYSLGSSDNAFLGLGYKIKIAKHQQVYGQFLLDEFLLSEVKKDAAQLFSPDSIEQYGWWANKQAAQLGFKSFNLFNVHHLDFQAELNAVRPYTYAHGSVQQNFGHLNQPLAHPLGANFYEWLFIFDYRYKDFLAEAKVTHSLRGADTSAQNFGGNIFLSYTQRPHGDYGYHIAGGQKVWTNTLSLRISYIFRPLNGRIDLGIAQRVEEKANVISGSPVLYFSIRTYFGNFYNDY